MHIVVQEHFESCCKFAADMIIKTIRSKPDAHLGLATGGTAQAVYIHLVEAYRNGQVDFSGVSSINLDEYVGIDPAHQQSYRRFMDDNLFNHINIDKKNTYVPKGLGDAAACVAEFREVLESKPRDIQLLGIGVNGHIAFNEPGPFLHCGPHVEQLDPSTIEANSRFFASKEEVPKAAISMGLGDIMKARRIVLVADENKAQAIAGLVMDELITTNNPSTMLKMHPDATVVIPAKLAQRIGYFDK